MVPNAVILVPAVLVSGALVCDFLGLLPKLKRPGKTYYDIDGREWVRFDRPRHSNSEGGGDGGFGGDGGGCGGDGGGGGGCGGH